MARMEEPEEQAPGAPMWVLSYGDMVTSLLGFFILLFAMSKVDNAKVVGLLESLSETFNPKSVKANATPTGPVDNPFIIGNAQIVPKTGQAAPILPKSAGTRGTQQGSGESRQDKEFRKLLADVKEIAKKAKLEKQLTVTVNARGVVITFSEVGDSLENVSPFESGSAALRPDFQKVLNRLGPILKTTANKIEVQGHTDRRPIHSAAFPSNWELSGARAGSVVRYLTQHFPLNRHQFVCTGFADTLPVDLRDDPHGWARNRRIEIVVTRQPIELYDTLSRAEAAAKPVDITAPVGLNLTPTGLPEGRSESETN